MTNKYPTLTSREKAILRKMSGDDNDNNDRRGCREYLSCGGCAAIITVASLAFFILLGLKSNEADNKHDGNNNTKAYTSQALIEYLGGMQTIAEINVIRDSKGNVIGCNLNLLEHASNLNLSNGSKIETIDRKANNINQKVAPSQSIIKLNPKDGFRILYEEVDIIENPKKQTKTTFSVTGSCDPNTKLSYNGLVDPSNHKIVP